mmetsp:Transcript_19912/g.34503  ORF Transcript_19912/g.34503 Transcript_19912/m.34503 type:complete len:273 (-) Transcript_19912:17-835(-)
MDLSIGNIMRTRYTKKSQFQCVIFQHTTALYTHMVHVQRVFSLVLPGVKSNRQRVRNASEPHLFTDFAHNPCFAGAVLHHEGQSVRSVNRTRAMTKLTEILIFVDRTLLGVIGHLEGEIGIESIVNRSLVYEENGACFRRSRGCQAYASCTAVRCGFGARSMNETSEGIVGFIVSKVFVCLHRALGDKYCRLSDFCQHIFVESICISLVVSICLQGVVKAACGTSGTIKVNAIGLVKIPVYKAGICQHAKQGKEHAKSIKPYTIVHLRLLYK